MPYGEGTFVCSPVQTPPDTPTAVDWGINLWNREDGNLNDRDYATHVLNADTVGSPTPDVFWFELRDGWFFDSDQVDEEVFSAADGSADDNVKVCFEDTADASMMYADCTLRIVGLTYHRNYIMLFIPTAAAFANPGASDWPGIFDTGHTYNIHLEDPHFTGLEDTFTEQLTVTGANPNL